jgi:hypothetical protein
MSPQSMSSIDDLIHSLSLKRKARRQLPCYGSLSLTRRSGYVQRWKKTGCAAASATTKYVVY